jgi:hypothetical protein
MRSVPDLFCIATLHPDTVDPYDWSLMAIIDRGCLELRRLLANKREKRRYEEEDE